MPDVFPPALADLRALALAAALGAMVGCAHPVRVPAVSSASYAVVPTSTSGIGMTSDSEPPKIVIRDYRNSPIASVLGWKADEAGYGLRASVRLEGSLVRDHQLYVSTYAVPDWRLFIAADWRAFSQSMEAARVLLFTGVSRDEHSCEGRHGCSPYETFSARVPDGFLRASRDSVVVKLYGRDGSESLIILRRDLINSYLAAVDSVSAARRNP